MKVYQYLVKTSEQLFVTSGAEQLTAELNSKGQKGWKLIAVDDYRYIFMRESGDSE